jgi:hypothetical protein
MLRDENKKLKQAERNTFFPTCDLPQQNQLSLNMQRLKEQNDWLKLQVHHINKTSQAFLVKFQ